MKQSAKDLAFLLLNHLNHLLMRLSLTPPFSFLTKQRNFKLIRTIYSFLFYKVDVII